MNEPTVWIAHDTLRTTRRVLENNHPQMPPGVEARVLNILREARFDNIMLTVGDGPYNVTESDLEDIAVTLDHTGALWRSRPAEGEAPAMRLRIVSDGTSPGTHVIDTATGARLKGVQRVEWELEVHGRATAVVTVLNVELDSEIDSGQVEKRITQHIDAQAMEAARAKAQEWNELDPPSSISADAARQIVEAYVGALDG